MSENVTDFKFLSGVKVVDFTQFEAGPSCTEALAWLGADVVKIENPKMGDPGRRLRPGQPDNDPYYFHVFNANKRSITVNLKSPKGLALVKDMIRQGDVMIENFAPGAIERLGLGYDVVKAINPGIIYAQVKGFGEGSPYEKNLAFDMIAQACGGTFSVTGDKNGPPTRPGISLGDTGTGMLMAITILGALYKRRETGEGHRLQVAMQDAIMHYMRINFATNGQTGKAAERGGSKVPGVNNAPMGLYPCAPGGPNDYVYIFAQPQMWKPLINAMGKPELADDPLFATPDARWENRDAFAQIMSAWTMQRTKFEVMKILGDAGVPCGACQDTGEVLDDPHLKARDMIVDVDFPTRGSYKTVGCPIKLSDSPAEISRPPMLGEHTAELLRELCGMDETQVARMKEKGIV